MYNHDMTSNTRQFSPNDLVLVKNLNTTGQKWIPGCIIEQAGPLSYIVKLEDGKTFRCHVDHLVNHFVCASPSINHKTLPDLAQDYSDFTFTSSESTTETVSEWQQHRYPVWDRHPPDRYRP